MEEQTRPVIGVTTGRRDEAGNLIVNPNIVKMVEEAGGVVRPFDFDKIRLYELIGEVVQIDGFIFPGGGDVHPGFYGEEKLPECGEPNRAWDELETNLFALLMTRNLPILGICRGCQMINVGFGGTLWQDLPSQKGVMHRQDDAKGRYSHYVDIVPTTRLGKICETEHLQVNSYHHQAVKDPAPGFTVAAVSDDGIIEAIEGNGPGQFILGVQWHPEVLQEDPVSKRIFAAYMDAVVRRRAIKCSHEEDD